MVHSLTLTQLKRLYKRIFLIRSVEEEIASRYSAGKMRCPTHLSIGQESVPAILEEFLNKEDYAISTHRGHAHYLAKGGNLNAMIAELYGKETGCSKGRGGSMHLIDLKVNFMGTSAIVGNSIPIGVGLALSAQLNLTERISVIYLGDAAVEEGAFYEAANFSVVRNLPVIFICENNLYSVYTNLQARQPSDRSLTDLARGIGLKTFTGDGCDIKGCYETLKNAVSSVRKDKTPTFVEMKTYRWREHCGPNYDNHIGYRAESEFLKWQNKDPLKRLKDKILSEGNGINDSLSKIERTVLTQVNSAFDFAEESPFPDASTAYRDVYARDPNNVRDFSKANPVTIEEKLYHKEDKICYI